jgi:hypothetical protein
MTVDNNILASPLFSDDWERAQRPDEWSYPKGIARDGMIGLSMDMRSLGDQYFEAAEAIVSLVMNNGVPDYTVSNPIMYLYRHAVELYLKAAIEKQTGKPYRWPKGKTGHELDLIVQRAPHISDVARSRIMELHAIDPKSTHLRFGGTGFPGPEGWAEMTEFRDSMRALREHLVDLVERLAPKPVAPSYNGHIDPTGAKNSQFRG